MLDAIVVDDQEVVRAGLRSALETQARVLAEFGDPAEAVKRLPRRRIDLAIVEYRFERADGAQLCSEILRRSPATAVIVHSSHLSEDAVRRCMLAGAGAYVAKSAGLRELFAALEAVGDRSGESPRRELIERQLHQLQAQQSRGQAPPTPRQAQILELAAEGLTNLAIAERLYISESTVRFHFKSLREKFGARSKTELIAKAMRAGLIGLPAEAGALVG